jgi:hypothetical protein
MQPSVLLLLLISGLFAGTVSEEACGEGGCNTCFFRRPS